MRIEKLIMSREQVHSREYFCDIDVKYVKYLITSERYGTRKVRFCDFLFNIGWYCNNGLEPLGKSSRRDLFSYMDSVRAYLPHIMRGKHWFEYWDLSAYLYLNFNKYFEDNMEGVRVEWES